MQKKRLKSLVEYLLFIFVLQFFRIIPYYLGKKIIVRLFLFFGLVIGIRKKVVLEQLKQAFPTKSKHEIKIITRNIYKNLALTSLEMFVQKEPGKISIDGWKNVVNALKLNRGLIIISGHLGNWELAGRFIARQNLPLNVVIKRLRNNYFNDFVNRTRARDGIKIIYKTRTMRPVLAALKNNQIVVMLIDQNAGKDGINLSFMNREASVFTGFARLAERYNTPLVLGIALRDGNKENRFIFEKHILPEDYPENEQTIRIVEHFNSRLEHYIKENPDQWFWLHRRWKGVHKGKSIVHK